MKANKKLIAAVALPAVMAAAYLAASRSADNAPAAAGRPAAKSAEPRGASRKIAEVRVPGAKDASRIEAADAVRESAGFDDEEYTGLSPEMQRLMAELQQCLDDEDHSSLSKVCGQIARIQRERGREAVPAAVRERAVEAVGLLLPESLAELVDFLDDPDQEVVDAAFDQLDTFLNDTTVGDKELSSTLVALSKVIDNEDSLESMAMAIDMNMRNSMKVTTYSQILDTGTDAAVAKMKESIADLMEVEVSELPSNAKAIKRQLEEWLKENPDGEDDADFYKGVDD